MEVKISPFVQSISPCSGAIKFPQCITATSQCYQKYFTSSRWLAFVADTQALNVATD